MLLQKAQVGKLASAGTALRVHLRVDLIVISRLEKTVPKNIFLTKSYIFEKMSIFNEKSTFPLKSEFSENV